LHVYSSSSSPLSNMCTYMSVVLECLCPIRY
jgi:hypothetical protein